MTTSRPKETGSYIERLFWQIEQRPEAIAFELGTEQITFGELYRRAQRYAAGLKERSGVEPGDRVLCQMETSFEMIVALLGHYLLGAIHVPVNTRYGPTELRHILADSGSRLLMSDTPDETLALLGQLGAMSEHVEVTATAPIERLGEQARERPRWRELIGRDEDTALCLYTSGTTGKSKGVMLSFRAVVAGIEALTTLWRFDERDRVVLALPLFHVHGLGIGVHGALLQGAVGLLQPRFDVEQVVEAFAHQGATVFMGVPTMYARLVAHLEADPQAAKALADARLFTSGSAALSAELFERFERATSHRILERYGMSETLLTISNPYEPEDRRPGTIGSPIASCEVALISEAGERVEAPDEIGELLVRGESLMSGYWRDPSATRESEVSFEGRSWFRTGDAARYDERGHLVHVGRRSVDILKVGGYKIAAREIEEVLHAHPGVEEAAVFGVPDEEWGERIACALVMRAKAPPVSDAQIQAFVAERLARYKIPRQIMRVAELPRNALGKVQKHHLKQNSIASMNNHK